mgnify:FL=1
MSNLTSQKEIESHIVAVFCVVCLFFGCVFGLIGLGVGLIFMGIAQAIGLGILCCGIGAMYSAVFGATNIITALAKTEKEMKADSNG